jgi:hypothetical protein
MFNMKIIEYIKTLFLEFGYIKDHVISKTNKRLMQKKISNMVFDNKNINHKPSTIAKKIYEEKYQN